MLRKSSILPLLVGSVSLAVLLAVGCSQSSSKSSAANASSDIQNPNQKTQAGAGPATAATASGDAAAEEHGHKAGEHGGIIVSIGRDSYHVEAIITSTGEVRLYTLGNDESRIQDIEFQNLVAYVKPAGGADSTSIEIKPEPQPGDGQKKSSLFVGQLPSDLVGKSIDVTVPNITIAGERFRLGFTTKTEAHGEDAMPGKVVAEEEKNLYLTPGGIYTQADIEANGNMTVSQKFAGFMASHDLNPKVGDKICPVTLTKANPKCSWIVGGKTYEFCCPPCVDEFVKTAKAKPEDVKEPDYYVKRDAKTEVK